jgi:Pyridoxamine 5'-phosphate oxidase
MAGRRRQSTAGVDEVAVLKLSLHELDFLTKNRAAGMITSGTDGMPKVVRVGVAVVNGELWSSGTRDRIRTPRLRHDPRCTLFVFGDGHRYLSLETIVTILDGPDVGRQSLQLFRVMQGRPTGPLAWFGQELEESEFVQQMTDEDRIVYEFHPIHSYGLD